MSLKAASAAAALLGTGGTVLCSARLDLPERFNFLSLDGVSPNSRSIQRLRSRILVNEDSFHAFPHRLRLVFSIKAADSTQPSSLASPEKDIITDDEFSLAKVSFGVIGLSVGVSLLSYGFGAYFNILPGSEWSAIMLTYGFPLAIIGMALKYAELKPVECLTYSDAQKLRDQCATPILKQVRDDVIRYRYGDEQHLEEALKRIFQYGQGGGIARRSAPILQKIREEVTEDGKYCLVLVFEAKALKLSDFEQRQPKFASFFGPGITAEVVKGEKDLYEVRLISNTTL
ncbi:thylakoid membrane protein slr0575 [Impatiens glandulifera]|uniref:thylakoid membrane protein slr0575 n=1 Tax=Impatiens glandulifera TaxID=253017 RepID=UPI001FB13EBF|nr:thylakoid membrane protein slr0575 [Impatiens glandulifera]